MTKVKFFDDFYCFEYQTNRSEPQRVHFYLYASVYAFFPVVASASTHWEYHAEKTVYSSDFLPSRIFRELPSLK